MEKVTEIVRSAWVEAMKINWPSRAQVVRYTLVVLGVSAAVAAVLGTLDAVFSFLFRKIILGE